jgi:hypothetical protein
MAACLVVTQVEEDRNLLGELAEIPATVAGLPHKECCIGFDSRDRYQFTSEGGR